MPDVHQQDQADETPTLHEITGEERLPVAPHRTRNGGESVARKIGDDPTSLQTEEVDVAGPAGCFADECKAVPLRERIDRRGLARVRTSGEGHLRFAFGR